VVVFRLQFFLLVDGGGEKYVPPDSPPTFNSGTVLCTLYVKWDRKIHHSYLNGTALVAINNNFKSSH
jgi:hypothetical protein